MKDCPVDVGDILADKYRVEKVLGCGGMGVVVAAWHLELEQLVAMKFLLPDLAANTEASERFRREARAAVKIKSEHVARVLDVGTMDGGVPYMVMEYMEGKDLGEVLDHSGAMPVQEAVSYVLQACEAIAEAHSIGIVHRDLKPANLFLTQRTDGSKLVKVLDFGISKSIVGGSGADMSLTRTSAIVGSPLYMSPEQLESAKNVDPRSDIWSLGVILYELISGSVPFGGDTIPQLVRSVLAGYRKPLDEVVPGVPKRLESIVASCLSMDKEGRFSNVAELTQALVEFGPQRSMVSAERVSRLLDVPITDRMVLPSERGSRLETGTMLTGSNPGVADSQAVSVPLSELSRDELEEQAPATVVDGSPGDTQPRSRVANMTVASWGTTDPGTRERNGRRLKFGLLAAAAVLVVGVGGVLLTTTSGTQPASSSAAAAEPMVEVEAAANQKPVAVQPVLPDETLVPDETAEADSTESEKQSAGGAAPADSAEADGATAPEQQLGAAAAVDSAAPAATASSAAAETKAGKPRPKKPWRPKPKKPAKQPEREWTDFGGRR